MPNALFEPIIGSGFDAIASQRAGYANFNRAVQEGNIGRANAAELNQNNYLEHIAQMQQREAEQADHAAIAQARLQAEASANTASTAEDRRRYGLESLFRTREQNFKEKSFKDSLDAQKAEQKRQLDATENTAKFIAKDAKTYADNFKKANQELNDATAQIDTAGTQAQSQSGGKIAYNNKTKQFEAVPKYLPSATPAEIAATKAEADAEAAKANAAHAAAKARYDQAVLNHKTHQQNWFQLKSNAQKQGLDLGDDGTVFSALHNKTFGEPVSTTPETAASNPLFSPVMGSRAIADHNSMLAPAPANDVPFASWPFSGTVPPADTSPLPAMPWPLSSAKTQPVATPLASANRKWVFQNGKLMPVQ